MKINWLKEIYFIIGIIGLMLFRQLPEYWCYIAIIPIVIGFNLYYSNR